MKIVYKIANLEFEADITDEEGLHFFKEKCWSWVKYCNKFVKSTNWQGVRRMFDKNVNQAKKAAAILDALSISQNENGKNLRDAVAKELLTNMGLLKKQR